VDQSASPSALRLRGAFFGSGSPIPDLNGGRLWVWWVVVVKPSGRPLGAAFVAADVTLLQAMKLKPQTYGPTERAWDQGGGLHGGGQAVAGIFGCLVALRPRLRAGDAAGVGAIGSGAAASSRTGAAGISSRGAVGLDRGGLPADRGELITAMTPAHGCSQVNWAHWARTITAAIRWTRARTVASMMGLQSDWIARLMVAFIFGFGAGQPGPLRASPVGWKWCAGSLRPRNTSA